MSGETRSLARANALPKSGSFFSRTEGFNQKSLIKDLVPEEHAAKADGKVTGAV
jgi:hypothetical protein